MLSKLRVAIPIVATILTLILISFVTTERLKHYNEDALVYNATTTDVRMQELDCLARNIYFESASEPFEGKVAVAQVTMNRVASGKFPDSVCGVVYQKNVFYEKVVCQFSWYCERPATLKVRSPELYEESMKVAKKVLLENFRLDGLQNALYYHADYVNPGWRKTRIVKIGHHIFYQG